jgi:hypothetical protein
MTHVRFFSARTASRHHRFTMQDRVAKDPAQP